MLPMRLRLRGANVLAGLHLMITDGNISLPLPRLYEKLGSLTELVVEDEDENNDR